MATRLTMAADVRMLIDEKDSTNSHFTDVEIYGFLNKAIRFMGTDLEWALQTAQATSADGQAVYTLPEDFISLVDVYFDNREIPVIERPDLSSIDPSWQSRDASRPIYTYKADNAKIGLWPKPDADNASKLIQIQYIKLPPDLASDTDVPDLHTAFQDCLPFYAAYLCEKSMGNSKRADENMDDYKLHKKALESKVQNYSGQTLRWIWK